MTKTDFAALQRLHDPTNQYGVLSSFPDQINIGITAADAADFNGVTLNDIAGVVVCGMGGSAIGGDILRGYIARSAGIPVLVNRGYHLPAYVNRGWLIVVMSYSGNTEESLSSYEDAQACGARIVCISSGGDLVARAEAAGHPVVRIPGGLAPRFALGYLFFALLRCAERLGFARPSLDEWAETSAVAREHTARYAALDDGENPAQQIASRLHGKLPVIYSGQEAMHAVALRWRGQIEENAKTLSYGNAIPEMNHNEVVGWEQHPELLGRIAVLALRAPDDDAQVVRRFDVTLDQLRPLAGDVIQITPHAVTPLARIIELICLGDWVSFYLAIGTGVDPFPILKINALKSALAAP